MEKELNIDWANLSFGYIPTDYNVRCTYKNGEWGEIEVSSSELIPMHMAASCLHYGQEAFEGLKACGQLIYQIDLYLFPFPPESTAFP